jgi:hypothetical protein
LPAESNQVALATLVVGFSKRLVGVNAKPRQTRGNNRSCPLSEIFENLRPSAYLQDRMTEMGKFLVIAGLLLAALGAILWSGIGRNWLGRLPGDIHYSKGNFSFYFPLMTCLLASLLLTLVLWLFRK